MRTTGHKVVTRLAIKVVPGSSRNRIDGWLGESLKVRVQAPPEAGKANQAVLKLIAGALGVGPKSVAVVAGGTAPRKVVEISGLSEAEVYRRLAIKIA